MPGDSFYSSPAWRTARREYLRSHPNCSVDGCGRRAGHVDHRIAISRGGARLDPSNFQALCLSCHSRKTAGGDGGFGNAGKRQVELRAVGCDANGWPVDPGHHWRKDT